LRRRRVAIYGAVAATLAVIVIVLAVAVVPRTNAFVSPATPHPAPTDMQSKMLNGVGLPTGGRFVDARHGYLTLIRCAPHGSASCALRVVATSDGGATFRTVAAPAIRGESAVSATRLYVFDVNHLVLDQPESPSDRPASGPSGSATLPNVGTSDSPQSPPITLAKRWVSADAGATWTPVSTQGGRSLPSIAPQSQLINNAYGYAAAITSDGVMHPIDAAHFFTVPPVIAGVSYIGEFGGLFFVNEARDPGTIDDLLQMSRDDGRTWQTSPMPEGASAPMLVGYDGKLIYGHATDPRSIKSVIIASSNGGRTWQRLDLPDNVATSARAGLSYAIRPGGGLLFADGSRVWLLTDGHKFGSVRENVPTIALLGLGPAIASVRTDRASNPMLAISTDGSHWRTASIH
jgi:hypothetical protein